MADIQRQRHNVRRQEIHKLDVLLVGKYDKGRSPMLQYMEWSLADMAQQFGSLFGSAPDQQMQPGLAQVLRGLAGDKAGVLQL
jgi:hypothetical protein